MKSFINVLLIILILFTLLYFNVLEAYTAHTNTLSTTSIAITQDSTGCRRGDREQSPIHNMINNSNTSNRYLIGNNIRGFL